MNKHLSKHINNQYKKAESEISDYFKNKKPVKNEDVRLKKCKICMQFKNERYFSKGKNNNYMCYDCRKLFDIGYKEKQKEIIETSDIKELNKNYNKMLRGCGNGK